MAGLMAGIAAASGEATSSMSQLFTRAAKTYLDMRAHDIANGANLRDRVKLIEYRLRTRLG